MSDPFIKKVPSYFQTGSQDLLSILAKAKELTLLNQKVSAYIDTHLAKYCQVANLVGNKLTILAANGSIATQLRFQTTDLLRKFKQNPSLQHIQEIHCIVRPPHPQRLSQPPEQRKMSYLSLETAEIIQHTAESLGDPTLKKIMESIAKHVAEGPRKK